MSSGNSVIPKKFIERPVIVSTWSPLDGFTVGTALGDNVGALVGGFDGARVGIVVLSSLGCGVGLVV